MRSPAAGKIVPAALLCLVAMFPAAARAARVVRVSPVTPNAGDRGSGPAPRVTFSPDSNGIRDTVRVSLAGRPGERVSAIAYVVRHAADIEIWRSRTIVLGTSGRGELVWNGRNRHGQLLSDGSYLLSVCPATSVSRARDMDIRDSLDNSAPEEMPNEFVGRVVRSLPGSCSRSPIVVHLQVLTAWITSSGSFVPGRQVPVHVSGDPGSVKVGIYPDASPLRGAGTGVVTYAHGGELRYRLPTDLAPGLYQLGFQRGRARRFVPCVVRDPRPLEGPDPGTSLVVLPYLTWRAYNEFDSDRNGSADTWYNQPSHRWVTLRGPYEYPGRIVARGLPQGTMQDWQHSRHFTSLWQGLGGETSLPAQFITDFEFTHMRQKTIARYQAVIFPAHSEYYLQSEFNLARAFQNHGRFAYLSANGFYALVRTSGKREILVKRPMRTSGQSDYWLLGVGYTACCWNHSFHPGIFKVSAQGFNQTPWLWPDTAFTPGSELMRPGGEVDNVDSALSPANTLVLASTDWTDALGRSNNAEMSWLQRPGGGEVFAAGNMGFMEDASRRSFLRQLLMNLWTHLLRP